MRVEYAVSGHGETDAAPVTAEGDAAEADLVGDATAQIGCASPLQMGHRCDDAG
jgi:hypothetical protein